MSTQPEFKTEQDLLEQTRQQINQLIEEVARLTDAQMSPQEYFAEFLQRLLAAMTVPAGAVWVKTIQGNLQLQYQIGLNDVGLDQVENGRECHYELLRQAAQQARPAIIPPKSGPGTVGGAAAPSNLTNYVLLLTPIIVEKQVAGVFEIWHESHRGASVQRGFLHFMGRMADFASAYLRNHQLRQMLGQQHLWTQLESYSRQIHGSLKPREVAYLVVNEGRRLIDCDRVSVAVRQGSWTTVEAISGADVIQKRSSLVQTMRALFDEVIKWGERLVYSGTKDESLPPKVLEALDAYLAESNSKLLVVAPLRDEREPDDNRKPRRSALMMECFEPSGAIEQLVGRMDVVAKHAAPAVYNAVEYGRIPFRWALRPIARIKDGLRGNRLAIAGAIAAGLALFIAMLVFVPYTLRMDAEGELLPKERLTVYSSHGGRVTDIKVKPNAPVNKGDTLLIIEDLELHGKMSELRIKSDTAEQSVAYYKKQLQESRPPEERKQNELQLAKAESEARLAAAQLKIYMNLTRDPRASPVKAPLSGIVVTTDLEERLKLKTVKPSDPLMLIARRESGWEYVLWIEERQVGHVREALVDNKNERLKVEIFLASAPDDKYIGWLYRDGLAGQAEMRDNKPMLQARVELASVQEKGLDPKYLVNMPVGARVVAKINCGRKSMGYVWFYELWEFFYEHVLF